MKQHELAASSKRWMQMALEAFSRDESPDFAVHHAGVALEHLLKAYLCSQHPALIIESKDNFQSLLHAVGLGDRSSISITRTKTISLVEAFGRTRQLLRGRMTVTPVEFEPVFAARNGVAHAGIYDTGEEQAILTTCVRIAMPVLDALDAAPPNYWGHFNALVEQLVNEHATAVQVRVAGKIAHAKRAFYQRFGRNPSEHREAIIFALSARSPIDSEHDKHVDCPACEGRGWLHGWTNVDWHHYTEADGPETAVVIFHIDDFDCSVCGLILEGDELEEAGLPQQEYLFDEDPADHLNIDEDADYESQRDQRLS